MPHGWFKVRTPAPAAIARRLGRLSRRSPLADRSGLRELLKALRADPRVAAASPNAVCNSVTYGGGYAPNDRHYGRQWNLEMLDMESAWAIEHGTAPASDLLIAVLDSGVAWKTGFHGRSGKFCRRHKDMGAAIAAAVDLVDGEPDGYDLNQHGTHVAGIIHTSIDNDRGISGMAPFFTLAPVRVLDAQGHGTTETLADGIQHIINQSFEYRVINMSVSFPPGFEPGPYLKQVVEDADQQGIVMVSAVGNKGVPTVSYPAAYNEVIAVGAVDRFGSRTPYSNYGAALDVMAPGGVKRDQDFDGYPDGILSGAIGHRNPNRTGYWFSAGTSQASPHVAALAALILSNSSATPYDLTPLDVRNIILQTANDLGDAGWDPGYGYGVIDPFAALSDWQSIVSEPAENLGGYVDKSKAAVPVYPTTQFGVVVDDPDVGPVLFIETPEGLFCMFDNEFGEVILWQITSGDLESLMMGQGGLLAMLEASGGIVAFLDASGVMLGTLEATGGILAMLDASGHILTMLDASGGIVTLLDSSGHDFINELVASGGILAMLDASGGILAMLDASGGMIVMLDASGGMLAVLDASGGIVAFMDASGASVAGDELEATAAGEMVFVEEDGDE
ncbi:MAG: hypothetical protein CME06_09895 [Gemmatimonadetes bacterium]|nr:hypothetical protein [Gemmatimonadota bacterium]